MTDVSDFVRLVVEPVRLAVLGSAALGSVDIDDIADRLGVARRDVVEAFGRLRQAGLVTDDGALERAALRRLARQLPQTEAMAPEIVDGEWTADEATVLSRFFEGNRLTEVPAAEAKRLVVLERLAQDFEVGVRYPEREVNFMLQLYHADYAALRRYLVDHGFLTRADGVYWRTGGRAPV